MTTICATETCDLPVEDARVCSGCARRLELALGDVPGLIHELNTNLAKQSVMGGESLGGHMKQTEMPLPYDVNASTMAEVLRSTLAGWVRVVWEERYGGGTEA